MLLASILILTGRDDGRPGAGIMRIAVLAYLKMLGRGAPAAALALVFLLGTGCATSSTQRTGQPHAFDFGRDTFAFANELAWEYYHDDTGAWKTRRREPPPDYTLHCFPMVRASREFFLNARFEPDDSPLSPEQYRKQVRRIMAANSRKSLPPHRKIVIPGYPDLHSFSKDHEELLKKECGSAVSSYFQRGHWRMVLPFSRNQQDRTARQLLRGLELNWPPIVHVVVFPKLTINHAMLVIGAETTPAGIRFHVYDPNDSDHPTVLEYDQELKTFSLPANSYFHGGRVDVYEIYHRWNY
jgi:hypothetical protein